MSETCPEETKRDIIRRCLEKHGTCALGTCGTEGPRVTPIEYRTDGWHLYLLSERGKKFSNLAADPRVSVAVFDPFSGFGSLTGLQMTGKARVIPSDDPEYAKGISLWGLTLDKIAKMPSELHLIRVDLSRIEALMSEFKKAGYDSRQVLEVLGK